MKLIDLHKPSDDGKQYYSIALVSSNGLPLDDMKAEDSTYDILQFTNFRCDANIITYLKTQYNIDNWKDWKYYKIFFHGTNKDIDLSQIYKKYHKFFNKGGRND